MHEKSKHAHWKRRVFVFEAIYSNLIYPENTSESLLNVYGIEEWGDFEKTIFNHYLFNKEKYLLEISTLLNENWTIDRLNLTVLALILEAKSEHCSLGTSANLLIQQSVLTSSKYCDDNEFKFVNALLDRYLKQKCQS